MFEFIGLIIGFVLLGCAAIVGGVVLAGIVWMVFLGRQRPWFLMLAAAALPLVSVGYCIVCAVLFAMFIPNQPDEFFGDFNEPLPHGYVLTGLGKMPEYSYFDSTVPGRNQPALRGGVASLVQDGEIIYGAYGHLNSEDSTSSAGDHGYFIFDTRDGSVRNVAALQELSAAAGHAVHLVDSGSFRSLEPGRVRLRRVETCIYAGPPLAAFLYGLFLVLRKRFGRGSRPRDHSSLTAEC